MKKAKLFFVVLISSLLITTIANADNFQIYFYDGYEKIHVSYSRVRVFDTAEKFVFKGDTDKYGRITIRLNNGSYNCYVFFRDEWRKATIHIDGSTWLKKVYLH